MNDLSKKRRRVLLFIAIIALAYLLHLYTFLTHVDRTIPSYLFLLYILLLSLSPYLVSVIGFIMVTKKGAIWGAIASLLIDSMIYYDVFIAQRHSTAAIALITTPVLNVFLVFFLGAVIKSEDK